MVVYCLQPINLIASLQTLSSFAGAYAGCCYCNSTGEYSLYLKKMVYLDHRRFLPLNDPLRTSRENFPNRLYPPPAPKMKTMKYVDEANARYESASTQKDKNELSQIDGCKGSYALRNLPHHDRLLNTPVEPMHLIKDIVEHIVRFIAGVEYSVKVRKEEKSCGRFPMSWITKEQEKLPAAVFSQ